MMSWEAHSHWEAGGMDWGLANLPDSGCNRAQRGPTWAVGRLLKVCQREAHLAQRFRQVQVQMQSTDYY
jgi:hypothetical protein